MSKLYVGNLPSDCNESALRQLFQEHSLACTTILVKRGGYAFVDCADQSTADRAIDKLNGYTYLGSSLVVEPSVASAAKKRGSGTALPESPVGQVGNRWSSSGVAKVLVSNLPAQIRLEELDLLFSNYGQVQNIEKVPSRDPNTQSVLISYETQEQVQQAVNQLNGYDFDGNPLKVEMSSAESRRRGRSQRSGGVAFAGLPGSGRQTDFPLRILVQSDMVGAIIGRQGSTIRQITQMTRARVDVHRKDNVGSLEKAITIYGNPENCTNACKKILEVMQQEANNTNKGEITLKILAHNNLIGRIIGKGGNTIKRIMQDTDTKITVSSINDINSFNLERIITVKGSIDNMSKAESMISSKLRQSYENDLQAMAPQSMMFPGLHPMAMMSTAGMGYSSRGPGLYGSGPAPYPYQSSLPTQQGVPASDTQETTFLYIPNNSVGAIIGTKGSHIRNIIRFSGASVKIAPLEQDKPAEQQTERKVTIVGSPESQWKAQYLIFEKMREEGYVAGTEDVRLTIEILVPSTQVGRIIGKGGQNVRELQRVTGSVIKLSEQQATPPSAEEETTVHIIGPFFSVQSAQRRIRAMVLQSGAPGGTGGATRAGRGSSQEGASRSKRDGSATSQGGTTSQPSSQQQSVGSPSSQQQQQQQQPQPPPSPQ
ncbi:insulin-like growth factor 2 mRNA-binding protein 1 isoform X1 [Mycetomoellerius zeteki]|uniref:insulin-like growth factor 2 mRNA-binding protein 1 isoform X1 n=1 Tax=Mycetomoellerius zeteki TaxID=64791 RepID=UPI00084EB694|nr:PREDICTED: insulin-like growth factor 2 mRNA-binding protein 1 isoform X1 [Trachymyrmex zeteki]